MDIEQQAQELLEEANLLEHKLSREEWDNESSNNVGTSDDRRQVQPHEHQTRSDV